MGTRRDGRIDPGQPLGKAISARAWNRAQDAADIVLGEQTVFGAEAGPSLAERLFHKVFIVKNSSTTHRFGMIVETGPRGSQDPNPPQSTGQEVRGARPPVTPGFVEASLASPVEFVNRRQTANLRFAVLHGGRAESGTYATVCSHGVCLAMVRKNPGGLLPRVRLPVLRYDDDTDQNLLGIAEDSDCGPHELLRWTNIKPFSQEQQAAEGIESPVALAGPLQNVYYAVVRL